MPERPSGFRRLFSTCGATLRALIALGLLLIIAGCSAKRESAANAEQAVVDMDLLDNALVAQPLSFHDDVQPILDRRCVVCHGCFDAPCQLKLSSYEGITRGANEEKVYDGARIRAVEPTRLYIDARSPAEWREKGFKPVLNEDESSPERNLENSVLYQMLRLKELNPQRRRGRLPDSFDLRLDRKQVCTDIEGFERFSRDHPLWGMPYAMPNLAPSEYNRLVTWLAQGARPSPPKKPSAEAAARIADWEAFLNGSSNKQRLMSRYLYEHLFLAHIYFEGAPQREYYRLVRSRTPPGEPIDEIPTVRPFDDPGSAVFYYRLQLYKPSIVAKFHLPYRWSPARMRRYRELFLTPDYAVTSLPGYEQQLASNPFKTFRAIPPAARYRFMLDEARFFINGFIKGPVCRGQVALNVIEDHFWVMFFDPQQQLLTDDPEFLNEVADYLQMPAEWGNSTFKLLAPWTQYAEKQRAYMSAKQAHFDIVHAGDTQEALDYIWDGEGENPNAVLTVFRHFDSASVHYGLIGDYPETAWIIDYPLFERIHYLLVAGFDVYGNVGHQLNTRLYMDFLRMEGEDYFLSYLPSSDRSAIRDSWYVGNRGRRKKNLLAENHDWLNAESAVEYSTSDPQRELYRYLEARLQPVAGPPDRLNRCADCGEAPVEPTRYRVEQQMRRLTQLRGKQLMAMPDVSFVRVVTGSDPEQDLAFTLVLNKGYKSLTSIFADEDQRDVDDDTLTVVPGFAGMYPNFFLVVAVDDIEQFANEFIALRSREDYERFMARFGVRRTNPDFWQHADWFHAAYARRDPVEAGLFDLNRYENR